MAEKKVERPKHTGFTDAGNTRDVKLERVGKVTIYRRGNAYYLYYREQGKNQRRRIDGNLLVARTTATKVAAALLEHRPSPLGFERTTPEAMVTAFLDYIENVKGLAWRTVDRYRAAMDRFLDFCREMGVKAADGIDQEEVENFVKWLRGQTRARNGKQEGKKGHYKVGGILFILGTCRTVYNWAGRKRRMLPPYAENPFIQFPIDQLRATDEEDEAPRVFTQAQEKAFWAACSEWQRSVFLPLATYGMRAGELTHLLIENVDFEAGTIEIASKPAMHWQVKTRRRRRLPLTADMLTLLKKLIGDRKAGFVFLNEPFWSGARSPIEAFANDKKFLERLLGIAAEVAADPAATKRQERKAVAHFCWTMGQIAVKRLQAEFSRITARIGCPEFTRVHDLRHLFATRAQERGANPLLVQEIVGHTNLDMTKRYTHLGMDSKREVIESLAPATSRPLNKEASKSEGSGDV